MILLANRNTRKLLNAFLFLICSILFLDSCAYKLTKKTYVAVEPWKEWQIKLRFKDDSSFEMVDSFGCNTFDYIGIWHLSKSNGTDIIILMDSTKARHDDSHNAYWVQNARTGKEQIVKADRYFPIISLDTVFILKRKVLRFRGLDFRVQSDSRDLNLERAKLIEKYYVKKFGKRQFIETFGKGKGLAQARKTIMECGQVEIPLKL